MTTRIAASGPLPIVTSSSTAHRTTDPPTRPFQAVMHASASAVVGGAEAAVRRLPGGPLLAAAFRPASGSYTSVGTSSTPPATTPEGHPVSGGTPGSGPGGTAPGGSNDPALEGMLDENTDKNLYYIALQERISAENRLYTAYSNVLRVRHETMKNAIGNVR
jgi:hypothetical protein